MHAVSSCRITTAIEMASKGGGHVAHRCVDCVPGGRWGNTEQVVARWQSLVAFMKALDHLHQAMRSVSHRRTAMAIETASKEGTFCIVGVLIVAMVAAGAIRSEESPDGSIQWLPL